MSELGPWVWLYSSRVSVVYLFETHTGRARRYKVPEMPESTAGVGQWVGGRRFAALYVTPHSNELVLQVGDVKIPVDDRTKVRGEVSKRGFSSTLTVSYPGIQPIVLRQRTTYRALARVFDPAYDSLDEDEDDFLNAVAGTISEREYQDRTLEIRDPFAGPWELVDQRFWPKRS